MGRGWGGEKADQVLSKKIWDLQCCGMADTSEFNFLSVCQVAGQTQRQLWWDDLIERTGEQQSRHAQQSPIDRERGIHRLLAARRSFGSRLHMRKHTAQFRTQLQKRFGEK